MKESPIRVGQGKPKISSIYGRTQQALWSKAHTKSVNLICSPALVVVDTQLYDHLNWSTIHGDRKTKIIFVQVLSTRENAIPLLSFFRCSFRNSIDSQLALLFEEWSEKGNRLYSFDAEIIIRKGKKNNNETWTYTRTQALKCQSGGDWMLVESWFEIKDTIANIVDNGLAGWLAGRGSERLCSGAQ